MDHLDDSFEPIDLASINTSMDVSDTFCLYYIVSTIIFQKF